MYLCGCVYNCTRTYTYNRKQCAHLIILRYMVHLASLRSHSSAHRAQHDVALGHRQLLTHAGSKDCHVNEILALPDALMQMLLLTWLVRRSRSSRCGLGALQMLPTKQAVHQPPHLANVLGALPYCHVSHQTHYILICEDGYPSFSDV